MQSSSAPLPRCSVRAGLLCSQGGVGLSLREGGGGGIGQRDRLAAQTPPKWLESNRIRDLPKTPQSQY